LIAQQTPEYPLIPRLDYFLNLLLISSSVKATLYPLSNPPLAKGRKLDFWSSPFARGN